MSLQAELSAAVAADRVLTQPIDRVAYASDASFYRLIPEAVVLPQDLQEIRALFALSRSRKLPMTFRAAGTSLSGQAITDGLLVEVARHWRGLSVEDGGRRIRVQPGVIGVRANQALAPFGAKIGPDPASIATCTLGGILANNSSGMCCGVEHNAYHTLQSMTFMLPSGTVIDTARPDADAEFQAREPRLATGILDLRARILANTALRERIRRKYRTKNTTGYSLNAFLDYETAVDIFQHLLIGSEGTLAFIAEAVLNTVTDLPVKYTGLLLFPDLYTAADSIGPFKQAGAAALEIMDRAALRSVETQPGVPAALRTLPADAAGLLVEFQSARAEVRQELERMAADVVGGLRLQEPATFTHVAAEQGLLWKIRSGMFPSVGAVRKSGTTVIIEDVAFAVEHLANAARDLNGLFQRHGYPEAIIFGHAKDGNLHFVVTQGFNDRHDVDRYAHFIDDVVALVVNRYDGALKAEHGTGRNMAPFVETEWGSDGYDIMRQLKALADPDGLLNPGVIINADRRAHLANLKQFPVVEMEVDRCIECGFCEPKCPSRELTLTPRQRIVVRREMGRSEAEYPEFQYAALDTCTTCGLCATACPVAIDTGKLVKRFRHDQASPQAHGWAVRIAEHMAVTEGLSRAALQAGHAAERVIGAEAMRWLTGQWQPDMPGPAHPIPKTDRARAHAVYFPACVSRVMGNAPGERDDMSLMDVTVEMSRRAGVDVYIPDDVAGTCCGTVFSSKGYQDAHRSAINAAIERAWRWSDQGRLPLVIDTSPCAFGLKTAREHLTAENQARFDQLTLLDAIEFAHDRLLPNLTITKKSPDVALHPVCSVTKMGLGGKLEALARACSDAVLVPTTDCCGFAGDRGFLFPELTASATKNARQARTGECYSSSRTCEIGLSRGTGHAYRSFMYLLEKASR
jgi:D-lactate dehydrogenase